jgi:hypothetical protein
LITGPLPGDFVDLLEAQSLFLGNRRWACFCKSHGELTERTDLPDSVFAFPKQRKEPMTDASHVRNAIARFDQTIGVSDEDRALAFANIKNAAEYYGVDMTETDWRQLGTRPSTGRTAADRRASARKGAATRKKRGTALTGARKAAATRRKHGTARKAARKAAGTRKRAAARKTTTRKTGTRKAAKRAGARRTASARKSSTLRTSARRGTSTGKRRTPRRSK